MCLAVFCKDNPAERAGYVVEPICARLSQASPVELSSLQLIDVLTDHCGADICAMVLQPLLACCQRCLKGWYAAHNNI